MSEIATLPTEPEIRDQLVRMLSTTRFRNAGNQGRFLALVTLRALKNKKTSGSVVAKKMFAHKFKKAESTDVRVTASNLRATIKKYYKQEGADDLVCITLVDPPKDKSIKLPDGDAYTPIFTYNPEHSVSKLFKLGDYYLGRGTDRDLRRALRYFRESLKQTWHVGAIVSICEVLCRFELLKPTPRSLDNDDLLYLVGVYLDQAMKIDSNYWRLHAVGGLMFTIRRELDSANQAFTNALWFDKAKTEDFPPYFVFLQNTGNKSDALRLAKRHAESRVDDVMAQVIYAEILMRSGQADEALTVFERAWDMDGGNWYVNTALCKMRLIQERFLDAEKHYKILEALVDPNTRESVAEKLDKFAGRLPEALGRKLLEAEITVLDEITSKH